MSLVIRISVTLLLLTATYGVFVAGFYYASIGVSNEATYQKRIARLSYDQGPSLGYLVIKVLKTKAKSLSHSELTKVAATIIRYSNENGHDPFLVMAVIDIESNFRRKVVSSKGAVGLMQIRPFVARGLALELNISPEQAAEGLSDVDTNVMIGSYYLAKMKRRFGDLSLALEAYNLGPTRLTFFIRNGVKLKKSYTKKVFRSHGKMMMIAQNQV